MTQRLSVLLTPTLKRQLEVLSRRKGKTPSEVVRGLIRRYVEKQGIKVQIGALWESIGKELKAHGHSEKTAAKAILDYRRSRRSL
jgi:predicted DNA-binding protein